MESSSSSKKWRNYKQKKSNNNNNKPKQPPKSKQRKKPQQQQIWRVKEKMEKRNWVELPPDVTSTILLKVGAVEILENAQFVCSSWRRLCKDPLMWRSIDLTNMKVPEEFEDAVELAKEAIDRSCGQCVDINIDCFGNDELLRYLTKNSTQLRRLRLAACYNCSNKGLSEAVSKLPLLEEIDISLGSFSKDALEAIGRCPLLKSFKLNHMALKDFDIGYDQEEFNFDQEALTIAANMPELRHLMLFGNPLSNVGLRAILDGCPHLVSLDLRRCFNINLAGDLWKRCAEQIKDLRRPYDSIEDYPLPPDVNEGSYNGYHMAGFSDLELSDCDDFTRIPGYNYFSDYDDFTRIPGYNDFSDYDDFTRIPGYNDFSDSD